MARPIEPTPILKGKDAQKLLDEISSATYSEGKQRFLEECLNIYRKTKR